MPTNFDLTVVFTNLLALFLQELEAIQNIQA